MKANLFTIAAYALGSPMIGAGKGLQSTADGLQKATDVTRAYGIAVEAKGHAVKGAYLSKAEEAEAAEVARTEEAEERKHNAQIKKLKAQLEAEKRRHLAALETAEIVPG